MFGDTVSPWKGFATVFPLASKRYAVTCLFSNVIFEEMNVKLPCVVE
jgi:hypothetical protein